MDPRSNSLADQLRRTAARDGGKVALIAGDVRQTYAELDREVNRVANALAARGVRPGERVALLSRNCREYVVLVFAAAKAGAVLVPVNFMLGGGEVAYVLDHSEAAGLVVGEGLVEVAEAALDATDAATVRVRVALGPERDGWEPYVALAAGEDATDPEADVADDDPVQLMYTSGTESRPKGAMMTSRSLVANYTSITVDGEMRHDDVEVHALPLFHVAQQHAFLVPDVMLGATSVILPAPEPGAVLSAVQRHRATKLFCPPTVWISLLRSPAFDAHDLGSLRKGYYGAAIMPVEVLHELAERLPQVRLFNFYGQTEMSPLATVLRPEDQLRKAGSAGRAALLVQTRVVDDEGRDVEAGELGELVHRGPHATLGYWRDPEKTAESYQGGWFHTGDLGTLDEEGYVTIVDRKKDMIKTGGENVASREVEEVLYEHPGVAECAVFGIRHPYWIEAVTAVVVPRDGAPPPAERELVGFCRERLAAFKVPKYVVLAEALPKNPSGKILKRELRAAHAGLAEREPADAPA